MSISLPPGINQYGIVAGGTLIFSEPSLCAGDISYPGGIVPVPNVTFNGTAPAGSFQPVGTQIADVFTNPGSLYNQILALPAGTPLANVTSPVNLTPGVYDFTTVGAVVTNTITLNGSASDQWIFRALLGNLTFIDFFTNVNFIYQGQVSTCNIYWLIVGDFECNTGSGIDLKPPGTFVVNGNFNSIHRRNIDFLGPVFSKGNFTINLTALNLRISFLSQSNGCQILCIAPNIKVLLEDGSYKNIQDLKRGDYVAGETDLSVIHKIARIEASKHYDVKLVEMVTFEKDSLGENIPSSKLVTTSLHPIFYQGKRVPAHHFKNFPGVTISHNYIKDMIEPNENGEYILYDLQFEEDGAYIVEGVKVQSRKPRSFLTPLPKELYFNQFLHTDEFENDHIHKSHTLLHLQDLQA